MQTFLKELRYGMRRLKRDLVNVNKALTYLIKSKEASGTWWVTMCSTGRPSPSRRPRC